MFLGLILLKIVINIYANEEPSNPQTVYVKQSGNESNSGLEIGQEKQSLKSAYNLLTKNSVCNMKIVYDAKPLIAEVIVFSNKQKITIEGWKSDGSGNTEVAIDCDVHPGSNLFEFRSDAEIKYLAFHFPTSLFKENESSDEIFCLIRGSSATQSISNCRFIRPENEGCYTDIYLVYASGSSLKLDSVECSDESKTLTSKRELFYTTGTQAVMLSNLTLKNVKANMGSVLNILCYKKCDVTLNGSNFKECEANSYGALFVYFSNSECTFTVGDGDVTTFSSCSSNNYKDSGGIYLQMPTIKSANQIKWPEDGTNLIFDRCSAGEGESKRNIGICLEMADDSLFEEIAFSMKKSFAANYTRSRNMWNVVGIAENNDEEIDFVSKFLDPLLPPSQDASKIYVKSGGTGNGESSERPIYSLKEANELLGMITREDIFGIAILKSNDPIQAEAITFSKSLGIIIEGVNSDGNGNVEVAIDCDARGSYDLFTCEKEVEFKYLAFNFPISEKIWDSLIFGNDLSSSLTISNCRFVRVSSQSPYEMTTNDNEDDLVAGNLVCVWGGKVAMNTVTCTDSSNTVSFSSSTFIFRGTSEVSLNDVEICNVNFLYDSAIFILDSEDEAVKISIEGLSMNEVNSENGKVAGLEISLSSKESTVAIGRNDKCSFKSCTATKGKAGAMSIKMPKATSNLQLPSANNLEIDSSNTANSTARSIFIVAPDFDEFCKQEGSFEFANDYDNSTAGWIVGAKDHESEPGDVYEKYVKVRQDRIAEQNREQEREQDRKQKEKKRRMVVAIVIPIVVVAVVAVVVVVIVIVAKKKKAKHNANESKEQEMSSQE
ncbi:uncharacterized protein MONOS_12848 [Monocercomonoides exilis]|uniref:uncharacterized protein n=1 Tax=Monocercomonoides exilis TaxID=2049356 RepID=UPI00355A5F65|nr:hypothetical protein MONOS_12848 [Monocercomonoides exilis]|eukprot:MONOS_12848.1-p1 / transcript=MONOS_12848.1 / gene=MONOS_12848 / organism=Monocercomonoides_exilis_PA203 / gene_product=unspecified product / transcript_product=unspecified product / location=Mono_scaffold00742:6715-9210(-) / protein_length=832 / sequence_SO=supercontig / SO=protein_coding / is_pseudo=false